MKYDISVVIPFTPSEKKIHHILAALQLQTGLCFEAIAIANPKIPLFFKTPQVSYPLKVLQSQAGANYARNCGLEAAQADIVVFLDADCIPQSPQFLLHYYQLMTESSDLTGGGGPYSLPDACNIPTRAYHSIQTDWLYSGLISSRFETLNLLGGNLALRKSKLENQRFDPKLKFGGTEKEFLLRLCLNGHKFHFWPDQKVSHESHIYFPQLARKAFAQGKGSAYIQKKMGADLSHDLYLKKVKMPLELTHALLFYDFFFQIGSGISFIKMMKLSLKRKFHHIFSELLITKSIQESKERRV